ncbi:cysteine--tRNA ligase [Nocardioides sp. GCM10027113]|uniref:cysteine--tRNA ligase n=1 Tax=unclassified Nocardioides TaxID=2615069 RepID=UPI003614FF21
MTSSSTSPGSRMGSGVFDSRQRVGPLPARPEFLTLGGNLLPVAGAARLYVCGITPYDVTHLGHAATFVWADVLASVLHAGGPAVHVCRNVTDVDDVLLDAARDRGWYYDEFALEQEALFDQSMRALRVATPEARPRARHHVDAVQQLGQALLDSGAAYERGGAVWFRGEAVAAASGLDREQALDLSRSYGDHPEHAEKDEPFDVAVWRPSEGDEPAWPSPWGWGRPGWHAECAAMALATHGASVDVLVGGEDLVFPHHAYQVAMVEAVTGVAPFARFQLHVGEVRLGGQKMAKSTGNLVLVDEVLSGCTPAAVRLMLVNRRYDEPWDYDPGMLPQAEAALERLYAAAATSAAPAQDPDAAVRLLREDLDVPAALARAEAEGGEVARRLMTVLRLS